MAENRALALVVQQAGGVMLPADPRGRYLHRFDIKSSSSNRLYTISYDTAISSWACSCPGWRGHRNCKHLKAMSAGLARIGVPKGPNPGALPGRDR